ncbi:MAG: HEPN domain-containing protein [Candidatus Sumerlaeota bacterium]|nr:HEPN domain-containing protein [Candidatus Sumerlaeota bacterium]
MASALNTQVYVSRLSSSEKSELYKIHNSFPEANIRKIFQEAISDVLLERLILAQDFYESSRQLIGLPASSDNDLRTAINRAYYAVHHAIRVLVLKATESEADGHEQAIQELRLLLKKDDFRRLSGLEEDVIQQVSEARDNRCVADYSPFKYSRREKKDELIPITEGSWRKAAEFNLSVAKKIVAAAYSAI